MEFIQQNLVYVALALVSGAMLLATSFRRGGNEVNPTQATLLINRDDAVVIDVRDAGEFASGHLQGARNIPVARFAERASELEKLKDRPVIVCCASGVRSVKACEELKKLGFSRVHGLEGGISAWAAAGLPLAGKGRK